MKFTHLFFIFTVMSSVGFTNFASAQCNGTCTDNSAIYVDTINFSRQLESDGSAQISDDNALKIADATAKGSIDYPGFKAAYTASRLFDDAFAASTYKGEGQIYSELLGIYSSHCQSGGHAFLNSAEALSEAYRVSLGINNLADFIVAFQTSCDFEDSNTASTCKN